MYSIILHTDYVYAFAVGAFGTTFFMIVDLQSRLENSSLRELREMWTFRMILLRCLFGIGAATLVFVAFQTLLLINVAWSGFSAFSITSVSLVAESRLVKDTTCGISNTSLLVVLGFLSGYAQTFAPRFANKISDNQKM